MGPPSTWNMKMDTRGTQTDVVTDRHIADCLMELKSTAEFQDLTYRLSRSCTGEMNLIVTRDNTVGLLGAPFDPVCITITASGICYFSVLFAPVEVIDLNRPGEFDLRKFRHLLWKLNGRAGYGFCPGFKENDFPDGFQFEAHGLTVLRHPFTRVQAKECQVFLQLRRSSSRAVSQPLGLQLCSSCLKTLTDVYVTLKNWGEDLSLPAFAKFLPLHSHPPLPQSHASSQQPSSKSRSKEDSEYLENSDSDSVAVETVPVGEECIVGVDSPSSSVAQVCEITTDNSPEEPKSKMPSVNSDPSKLGVRGCMVLLDRISPSTAYKAENVSKGLATSSAGSTGSASSAKSAPSQENVSLMASFPAESLPASSSSSPAWSFTSSLATASNSNPRQLMQVSAEGSPSRPVLSARIKPFRAVMPHERETTGVTVTGGGEVDAVESAPSTALGREQEKHESSPEMGPPVLTPEVILSPGSSPQPLCIDEDADPEELETAVDEPEAKRPCYRCSACEESFPSHTVLQQHFSQQHQSAADLTSTTTSTSTSATFTASDVTTDEPAPVERPRGKTCPVCQVAFGSKDELETHLTRCHGTVLHPCRYCGQKFALKKNLADHLERHRGSKVLTCQECGRKFTKKKEFAAHVREHMGSLPFFCTVCSKLFSRENVFEEHMERHRARRGVRAVLAGSKKTMQGIMNKAKKCLEEKTLKALPSVAVTEVTALQPALLPPSVSDSLASPPSNLHLLSAVSLARAELDRQPNKEQSKSISEDAEMSTAVSESSDASAQLPAGLTAMRPAASSASSVVASGAPNTEDAQQTSVSSMPRPAETSALLQQLNAPLKMSGPTPVYHPEGPKPEKPQPKADVGASFSSTQTPAIHTAKEAAETSSLQGRTETPSSTELPGSGSSEHERALAEREKWVNQKEQELKERELAITRKNMMFFQQLMMAQLSQQPRAASTGAGSQGKGDKPSPQQALAMIAALNAMAAKGVGRGAPLFRPPVPGAAPKREKAPSQFHGNMAPGPVSADLMEKLRKGQLGVSPAEAAATKLQPGVLNEANARQVVSVSDSGNAPSAAPGATASPSGHEAFPMPPPSAPVCTVASTSAPALPHSKQRIPTAPVRPPPPPTSTAAGMSQRPASSKSQTAPTSSCSPPQPHFPLGGSFLEELMKLESKMPASAKEFLPKSQSLRPPKPLPLSGATVPAFMTQNEASESPTQSTSKRKGRGSRGNVPHVVAGMIHPPGPTGDKGGKKRKQSGWSGGVVEEKMHSVVTVVPPHEMQRLMALARQKTPVATPPPTPDSVHPSGPGSSSMGQSSPAAAAASPAATAASSAGSVEVASTLPNGTAVSSPGSPAQSPPGPRSCSTASPLSQASPTPSPSLQPMPPLIPAIPPASNPTAGSQRPGWPPAVPAPAAARVFEEEVPMDLTKGSSSKALAPGRTSGNQPADVTDAQPPVDLCHTALETSANQSRVQMPRVPPVAAETVISPTADAPVQPSQDFVPQKDINLQAAHAAAIQAQLRAQAQDPKFKSEGMALLRHFFPGYTAPPVASLQREVSPQRMASPQFPASPQNRIAPSPQSALSPPGIPSPRGRALQPSIPPLQDRVSLPRPPVPAACGSVPSPAGFQVSSPAEVSPASISPILSTAGGAVPSSAGPAPSPSGAMPSPSSAASSLAGPAPSLARALSAPPAKLTSPNANAMSSRQSVVIPHQTTVPNFLLPPPSEPSNGPRQQSQSLPAKPDGEKSQLHVNPLGGFAWHRPATVDPFQTPQTKAVSSTGTEARPGSQARQEEQEKDRERAPEIDLADQNLWQQQFLQTLREKRRQQQRLTQQQQQQPVLQAKNQPSHSQNQSCPSQRGRGRRKKTASAAEVATADAGGAPSVRASTSEVPSSSSSQEMSADSGLATNHVDMNSAAQAGTGMRGKGSRGRSGGRSRGRSRRNTPQPMPIVVEGTESERQVEEEGAELRGFGVEVKVEPLEAGVRCGGCGKVFFNETDILEHDCDGQ